MKSEISAGIIVYKEKNGRVEYLLLKGKGHTNFNFPKGTKEKGESDEKTARRETKEETGLDDIKLEDNFKEKTYWIYYFQGNKVKKEVTYFLGETKEDKVILSDEHEAFMWAEKEEAQKLLKFKNLNGLIEKADNFIRARSSAW